MKKSAAKKAVGGPGPAIEAVFEAYPQPVKTKLLALRRLIFDTAKTTKGVGALEEALKWGQPSYLTPESKSGSTIRIDQVKAEAGRYAVYFHCQTDLVETFREFYPELSYGGNRSILLDAGEKLPEAALRHCIALALTYHLRKRKAGERHCGLVGWVSLRETHHASAHAVDGFRCALPILRRLTHSRHQRRISRRAPVALRLQHAHDLRIGPGAAEQKALPLVAALGAQAV